MRADAERAGETPGQAMRHELLLAVHERVARTTGDFVLRGGLLTRAWIAPLPRPTQDLDYVGDFPFDVDDTVRRFRPALALQLDDGARIDLDRLTARGIWLESAFPGVHLEIAIGLEEADQTIGVDIGFHDPLVPPAVALPSGGRAVRPETQLAWKLHSLFELGSAWRPKDLADLWLITARVALVDADLPPAIRVAFASRGHAIADAVHLLDDARWSTKSARVRWSHNRFDVPPLADTLAAVRARLAPALAALEENR